MRCNHTSSTKKCYILMIDRVLVFFNRVITLCAAQQQYCDVSLIVNRIRTFVNIGMGPKRKHARIDTWLIWH